jgi:diguanylate cyclase (GGDEF)-like protein
LVYYSGPEAVTDFAGVPVLEETHLRGVLVADRKNGRPFDSSDLAVMKTIAAEVVRAVQVERIFADMDREKYQRERFYQASRDFNAARNVEDVAAVAIQAARRVEMTELAAVAEALDEENVLRIAAIDWHEHPGAADLVGKRFNADAGLVGAAIKARHPLPHGTARAVTQPVFAPELDVPIEAVKVLPLLWKDQGVGALVLGSSREEFLSTDAVGMLRVIADHAAIAIANAQMYERIERMATTDGLTGLTNHRQFQQIFAAVAARAERYGRPVSLILTDIDHFKSVNDTYGHPVGDKVLRRVADVLRRSARRTDVVARYGGEEFAVLMEETGRSGAVQIAERIRLAVEDEVFHCENGTFGCTLSLGIATFPQDAANKARLTECADQALYQAKRSGRNRVVTYGAPQGQQAEA